HNHEAAGQPECNDDDNDHAYGLGRAFGHLHAAIARTVITPAKLATPFGLAPKQRPQAIVEIAPDFVQIRRTVALIGTTRRLGAVVVTTSPTGIIQIKYSRH